jgi:hypothetical protein
MEGSRSSLEPETPLRRRAAHTARMTTTTALNSSSYILRLEKRGRACRVKLTDLRTARAVEFDTLEALVAHLSTLKTSSQLR